MDKLPPLAPPHFNPAKLPPRPPSRPASSLSSEEEKTFRTVDSLATDHFAKRPAQPRPTRHARATSMPNEDMAKMATLALAAKPPSPKRTLSLTTNGPITTEPTPGNISRPDSTSPDLKTLHHMTASFHQSQQELTDLMNALRDDEEESISSNDSLVIHEGEEDSKMSVYLGKNFLRTLEDSSSDES